MLDRVEDAHGARNADLCLAYLSRAFNWHASRVDEFRSPLVRGMNRLNTKERARSRTLTDDEIRKLWTATEPSDKAAQPFHALVRFLLLTGARRNEATLLPFSEIDGTDWCLPAARNKTKVDLIRPLSRAAQAIISAQLRIDDGPLVFSFDGRRPISPSRAKRALDRACGVTGWVLHDLRRTARTLMSRAGVNTDYAERALGKAGRFRSPCVTGRAYRAPSCGRGDAASTEAPHTGLRHYRAWRRSQRHSTYVDAGEDVTFGCRR
jgi:integrase